MRFPLITAPKMSITDATFHQMTARHPFKHLSSPASTHQTVKNCHNFRSFSGLSKPDRIISVRDTSADLFPVLPRVKRS